MSLFDNFRQHAAHPDTPVSLTGETALHLAVQDGDIAAAKQAIDKGASVGVFDIQGQTPLSRAAEKGDAGMVRFLLSHGAEKEIDYPSSFGTALGLAAQGGHLEAMGLLLDAGAGIDAPDDDGTTPLMQAIFGMQAAAAQFLLSRGADANATRARGETALHIAVRTGDDALLRALFSHGAAQSVNRQTDVFLQTPLHIAAQTRQEVSVRVLVEMGALAGIPNAVGNTPLGIAIGDATGNETAIIRLMIEKGNADTRDPSSEFGMPPLHQAVFRNKAAAARELVRLGADPEQGDAEGNTALHIAAKEGRTDIAAWLVASGMNPAIENKAGQTPLLVARLRDDDDMAALLIRAEKDYVIRNKKPKSQGLAPK